jgi:hypothetical protein
VLGKAKVISYEDIEEARAKHVVKDAINGKGKRGRKRKGTILDLELELDLESERELEPEIAHVAEKLIKGIIKRARKYKSITPEIEQLEPELERMLILEITRQIIAPEG